MTKHGLRVTLWAGAAVLATITAAVAIGALLGGGRDVLSEDQVARELADQGTSPSSAASPPATTDPTLTGGGEVVRSVAGSLAVQCTDAGVRLLTWSPNPGYRSDDVVRGPAAQVSVWFESDTADDVKVVVTCPAGRPTVQELVEEDDHGGGGGDNSGSGGGGRG